MKVNCDGCGREMEDPGGLAFSPPKDGMVQKAHLCVEECWPKVRLLIGPRPGEYERAHHAAWWSQQ